MSTLPKEAVKIIGESVGFANVSDDVAQLLASDLEYRLREITQEAAKAMRHCKRQRLSTSDINAALTLKNFEPMYGYVDGAAESVQDLFKQASQSEVYYTPDEPLKLSDVIQAPMPKLAPDIVYKMHWLAIEGVQPAIPQNPTIPADEDDEEPAPTETEAAGTSGALLEKKELVKHVLSREQQLLFQYITDGLFGSDDKLKEAAVESLGQDPGLHQLVPYFLEFLEEKISTNLRHLSVLNTCITMAEALVKNPNIFLEPYLHQLIPCVLSCIVGKRLCSRATEDHWSLRRRAAALVRTICHKFGKKYPDLQSRVTKTMIGAFLNPKKPLTTHFGAITCLHLLGPHVVDLFIIDNVQAYRQIWEKRMNDRATAQTKEEAIHVKQALLEAVGSVLRMRQEEERRLRNENEAEADQQDSGQGPSSAGPSSSAMDTSADESVEQKTMKLLPLQHDLARYKRAAEFFGDELAPFFA